MRLAVSFLRAVDRSDIEGGMRPRRLGQIFDDAGNAIVAFDQQHVALLDQVAQMRGIAGRKRLVARYLLLKVAGNHFADHVEHDAHIEEFPPEDGLWRPLLPFSYHAQKPLQFGSWAQPDQS